MILSSFFLKIIVILPFYQFPKHNMMYINEIKGYNIMKLYSIECFLYKFVYIFNYKYFYIYSFVKISNDKN